MAEILQREPDYKLYVDIQKIYAQMVVLPEPLSLPIPKTNTLPDSLILSIIDFIVSSRR